MFAFNPGVNDVSGQILGQAAVGAAQTTAGAQQQLASDIGSSLMSLATSYAGAKADAAELEGYDEVFKMHGNQLGFSGEDVDRFLKMPNQQRRAAYTSLYQNFLPHEQRMEYLNNQAALYPRGGTRGGAAGAGDYVVGQGWTGQ
jgi:hypothetical protein